VTVNPRLERLLSHIAEAVLARVPHAQPDAAALARAKIVSHRGERDSEQVLENTFAAFDPAVAAGVAAIECDIRYTRDHEPVVVHDADLKRVFGLNTVIADTRWERLQRVAPSVPHLDALLERYAERTHLMIELKTRGSTHAEQRLADLLAPLTPVADFHILSLEPELFAGVATLPAACYLPVAKLNHAALHNWALTHDCAGLAGPYALMRTRHIRELAARRDFVGSGFIDAPALLMREIGRGVEWIFSNHAVHLQKALDAARGTAPANKRQAKT